VCCCDPLRCPHSLTRPDSAQAVRAAHADLRPAQLSWTAGELLGANINRSPTAYAANPAPERARDKHDVDKEMVLLRVHSAGAARGGRDGGAGK
jgi:hypothetical protein